MMIVVNRLRHLKKRAARIEVLMRVCDGLDRLP
jgi:hypothetical protein